VNHRTEIGHAENLFSVLRELAEKLSITEKAA
jgi:hypothetical protein